MFFGLLFLIKKRQDWQASTSRRYERPTFVYCPTTYTWKPWTLSVTDVTRCWKVRGEGSPVGNMIREEEHGGELPGFSFCLTYSRYRRSWQPWKGNTHRPGKKSTKKSLLFLIKGPRKGSLSRKKTLWQQLQKIQTAMTHQIWNRLCK